jgi:hypothetical protein
MSIINNSVANIKGTPAMLTDTLANRPSAEILAVGTIFIDSATGNWYQVGTNNTWSSTGGSGGSSTLQQVLDNGNSATEQSINLNATSNNLRATISNSDDNTSYIEIKSITDGGKFFRVSQDNDNVAPILFISKTNGEEYIRVGTDYVELKQYDQRGILSSANNGIEYTDITQDPPVVIQNLQYQNTQLYRDTTNGPTQKIRAKTDNFFNQIIDIPKYSGTIATAEVTTANTISLTSSNYTVPTVSTQDYFIVTAGSVTNSIILTTGLKNLVSYLFLNQVNTCTFTTNTGGTIYGTHTGLNAGFFQIIRNGNDFFIDHP